MSHVDVYHQTDIQTDRLTDRHTDRHTDRQMYKRIFIKHFFYLSLIQAFIIYITKSKLKVELFGQILFATI